MSEKEGLIDRLREREHIYSHSEYINITDYEKVFGSGQYMVSFNSIRNQDINVSYGKFKENLYENCTL